MDQSKSAIKMERSVKDEDLKKTLKDSFGLICRNKDSDSENLNSLFDEYGCNTLEAKIPVVDESKVTTLLECPREERFYGTLAHKAKSANAAVNGFVPKTRNRVLKLVEVDNEIVIAAGETRAETPVDEDELNEDIEEYMKERARLKAKSGTVTPNIQESTAAPNSETVEAMDQDLDEYMKEANRRRIQKMKLIETSERLTAMDGIEEDFDLDRDLGGESFNF